MIQGIDVSSIQGLVDWPAVADAGITFAWVRTTVVVQDKAGARHVVRDARARENIEGARAAGVHVGGYAFFSPALDPKAQAQAFCDALGPVGQQDLRPAIDFEVCHGIPMFVAAQKACEFVEHVEAILGVESIVYTMSGASGFWPHTIDAGVLARRPLWVAHYRIDPTTGREYTLREPSIPPQWAAWAVWQISGNKGPRVAGIATDVDRNVAPELVPLLAYRLPDTLPSPPDSDAPTWPGTPSGKAKSSDRLRAVDAPIIDGPATPLRAGEGEHTVPLVETDFDEVP